MVMKRNNYKVYNFLSLPNFASYYLEISPFFFFHSDCNCSVLCLFCLSLYVGYALVTLISFLYTHIAILRCYCSQLKAIFTVVDGVVIVTG